MTIEILHRSEGKVTLKCAFCHGTGKDPFELLSSLATCQVCLGKGMVTVPEPARECVYCQGTGVHRDQRLTCTVCGGKGMVTIPEEAKTCPHCLGRGVPAQDYLPCSVCGGIGVVAKEKAA